MDQTACDLAVAGGGPAGLFCAIRFAEGGPGRVLLLEKMDRPGMKLLASGAGRCNISHAGDIEEFYGRYGNHGPFLKPALRGFGNRELAAWFAERGLDLVEAEGGKLFPASGRARDVLDILLSEAGRLGVEIRTGQPLRSASRTERGFELSAGPSFLHCSALVIAAGGRSCPGTGSAGEGQALAAAFGHRIVETAPALSPVKIHDYEFASCAGLALPEARLTITRKGAAILKARGDLLFTHEGLSGPVILDASRSILQGDSLSIALVSDEDLKSIDGRLLAVLADLGGRSLKNCLRGLGLAESLAAALLASLGLEAGTKAALVDRETRRRIAAALLGHSFTVDSLGGYDVAMATRGGVALDEVEPRTMASRLVPGLFFAGEVLDIDGDSGGFNLQAAFSTGALAARGASEHIISLSGGWGDDRI